MALIMKTTPKASDNKTTFGRSACPITNALDTFGDKWTLLIIRDLVLGKKRFQEFKFSPERIATNILADRLERLQACDIVTRHAYQHNPIRYEYVLTKKGETLRPILKAIVSWGLEHFPGAMVFAQSGNTKHWRWQNYDASKNWF